MSHLVDDLIDMEMQLGGGWESCLPPPPSSHSLQVVLESLNISQTGSRFKGNHMR